MMRESLEVWNSDRYLNCYMLIVLHQSKKISLGLIIKMSMYFKSPQSISVDISLCYILFFDFEIGKSAFFLK